MSGGNAESGAKPPLPETKPTPSPKLTKEQMEEAFGKNNEETRANIAAGKGKNK